MRLVTVVVAVFLLAPHAPAGAAVTGFDSAYAGESAFLTVGTGTQAMFQVFFMNTGVTTWQKGTATQVNLTVCLENKVTCNVPSPHADWNDGSWLSNRVYATHFQDEVKPGDIASFAYGIRVPLTAERGIYRFNGDLALPTGQQIHPEGYYQEALNSFDRFP
jgi:hypothetical protein